ncbi:aminopeptidase Ey-like [Lytechinus variegatus]|uniref:aminopeptidase Ey-like n=1 Tax=Lytechinus variegatus TaxID=7654 RepID=UPI001BB288A1|nr:aminopeptidase Ey-like [Lytechinus variegatus]
MLKFDFLENERLPDEQIRSGKRYLSKSKAIVVVVLFVLAIVIVGLLCGLLAEKKACHTRYTGVTYPPYATHHQPTQEPTKDIYERTTHLTPTSRPPPISTSQAPLAPWEEPRLPGDLKPIHYELDIQIDIDHRQWFNGTVTVLIRCLRNTNIIIMHSKQLDLIPGSASLEMLSRNGGSVLPRLSKEPWTYLGNQYLVVELDGWLVQGEEYLFKIGFGAELVDQGLVGLFRSSYKTVTGETRYLATTFFAPTNARMAFPCFDEPAMKATYDIAIVHQPDYVAISNMPVMEVENVTVEDGQRPWLMSTFQRTKPMSSYTICYVVCDFEKETGVTAGNIEFTIWARKEAMSSVHYALDKGGNILDYYNFYFSTEYPLPKMDTVAIPDYGVGAMENWGLLTFREYYLLYTPGTSSRSDLQHITYVMAHELAHQWFGNLVSFEWWNDLWLKEGFATYAGNIGCDVVQPDWGMTDQFTAKEMFKSLQEDASPSSRPIIVDVFTADDINQQYDVIVYDKAASIIRMIHDFLGEETFRRGLQLYVERYQYGNAVNTDLWNCFTDALNGSTIDVKEVMDTWTLQMGYPTVYVTRDYSLVNPAFSAKQSRFLIDPEANTTTQYDDLGYTWYIPIRYTTKGEANFDSPPLQWLTPNSSGVTTPILGSSADEWLLVNINAYGYYRVNYDEHNWQLLISQLLSNREAIPISNRAELIGDALNLARAGDLDYTIALNLTRYLSDEREYVPWLTATKVLGYINLMLSRASAFGAFQRYMSRLVEPFYRDAGLYNSESNHLQQLARVVAEQEACNYGNRDCITRATSMFASWMRNDSYNTIPPDQKKHVYCTAIAMGGETEWSFAFDKYESTLVASERALLLQSLACAKQPWILSKYLGMITDGVIRSQDADSVLEYVAKNPIGYDLAWRFFQNNWDFFRKTYGSTLFHFADLIKKVTAYFNTELQLRELEDFILQHPDQGTGARAFVQAVQQTKANIRWVRRYREKVHAWLQQENEG